MTQPSSKQLLLLRAALCGPDEALSAWRSWQAVDSIATTDPGSVFVLPQLYLNLRKLPELASDPTLAKLRGVYRHTWAKNRLAMEGAATATQALTAAGLKPLTLKGISLLHGVYRDLGARMMIDTDVAVPRAELAAADQVLTRLGFQAVPAPLRLPLPLFLHAVVYTHPKWLELDLHVEPLSLPCPESALTHLWQRSRPSPELHARVPDATDLLIMTLASGRKADVQGSCRWLVDAAALVRQTSIDWQALPERAAELLLRPTILAQLQLLRQLLGAPIPDSTLHALRAGRHHLREQQRDRMLCQIDPSERPLWALLPQRWQQYQAACSFSHQPASWWQFGRHCSDYLIWKYELRGPWQIPALVYRSAAKRTARSEPARR